MLIGNDIVDLTYERDHHPRFPRRVLNDQELQCYEDSGCDSEHLWLVWAAKESAYKLEKRRDSSIYFSPREFSVDLKSRTVAWRNKDHVFYCVKTVGCVHVWTAENVHHVEACTSTVDLQSKGVPASLSERVRELAVEVISARLNIKSKELKVQTDAWRMPYATRTSSAGEERINCVISMSHDGTHVGVAIGFAEVPVFHRA